MKQEIIDELNERINKYANLIKAEADTAAAIELAGYAGSIAGLEWAKVITESQYNSLLDIATTVKKKCEQGYRIPTKDELKLLVGAILEKF